MLPGAKHEGSKNNGNDSLLSDQTFSARLARAMVRAHESHRIFYWWPILAVAVLFFIAAFWDRPIGLAVQQWPAHERAFFAFLTGFGKSDWILIPTLIGLIVSSLMLRFNLTYSWKWALRSLQSVSAYTFVSVGLAGLIVVVLKRLIGRGRPLYIEEHGTLFFQPFDIIDWTLHSFPSGHSTTAMAFTIVLLTLTNGRYRGPIVAFGLGIALSRIVVGDHFFSDVIGGILVGTVTAWVVRDYFATKNWGMRLEQGRLRYRGFSGFKPLWRWLRRRHVPKLFA